MPKLDPSKPFIARDTGKPLAISGGFIARDTGKPLVIFGGYHIAQDGGIIRGMLPPLVPGKDTGADPLGNGRFRMYPSGDVVDYTERCRRLGESV